MRMQMGVVVALLSVQPSYAGKILVGGWFEPGFATGYVNGDYTQFGDTSGMQFGNIINFSSSALIGGLLKTLTFDSPVYGEQTVSFTNTSYLTFTPFGEFYQETNAAGEWLDVNIPYTGVSPSFSFLDYATAPPPPCVECVTPPPCIDCNPPPVSAPEPSTWAMMALGFLSLTVLRFRRQSIA